MTVFVTAKNYLNKTELNHATIFTNIYNNLKNNQMLQKKLKLSILLLLGLGLTGLLAQEAILATGGDASGGGGSVSWSAGTVVFRTYTGINGSVAESVQQPYEIS